MPASSVWSSSSLAMTSSTARAWICDFVRHEVLCYRVEMEGLHGWSVAAGR